LHFGFELLDELKAQRSAHNVPPVIELVEMRRDKLRASGMRQASDLPESQSVLEESVTEA